MKVKFEKFERATKELHNDFNLLENYHLNRKVEEGYVVEYSLYKKDISYFDFVNETSKGRPILSSENGDTFKDLKRFINCHKYKFITGIDIGYLLLFQLAILNVFCKSMILALLECIDLLVLLKLAKKGREDDEY